MCAINQICLVYVKLILTCTEHTSTMSPVDESQDYDYQDQDKTTYQSWSLNDDVC